MNYKNIIYIITISLTIVINAQQDNYCSDCKKYISETYIKVDEIKFHKDCFKCLKCKNNISGKFEKYQSQYFHPKCYKIFAGLYCMHCNQILNEQWIEYNKTKYHNECYLHYIQPHCTVCSMPLTKSYTTDDNGSYHKNCYRNHILPKCSICTLPLENTILKDPWGNKYHEYHSNEGVLCNSCSRVISEKITQGGFLFEDGRYICSLCEASIIKSKDDIVLSKIRVIKQLQNVGITSIPKDIPINIVDKKYLNNMSGSLGHNDLKGFTQIESNILNNNIINRVYHIYILFGLTKIEFDAVLAHELIHVWLEENEQTYSDAFTEGFCNLASALIYINDNTKFSRIHLNSMMNNNDSLYGDGYRKCKNLLNLYGWDLLIKKTLEGNIKF